MGARKQRTMPKGSGGSTEPTDAVMPSDWWLSGARVVAKAFLPGLSIGLFAFELWLPEPLTSLVMRNQISQRSREVGTWMVLLAIVAAILTALAGRRSRLLDGKSHRSWRTALSVAFVLPPILTPSVWHADPLLALVVGIGAVVAVVWSVLPDRAPADETASCEKPALPQPPIGVVLLLVGVIVGYAAFIGLHTVRQHQLLETRAWDLGITENLLWHTAEGRMFESSLEGRNHLGVHASFIYLILVPLYVLAPRPETILVAQAVLLALAALPLFLLARRLLESNAAALLVSVLYLLHPAVQGAGFYDFHELAFAPVLFFAAAYALETRSKALLWSSTVLLLLVKEDCAFIVGGLGLIALMNRRVRTGASLLAVSAIAIVVFQGVVIPHFAGGPSPFAWYFSDMIPAGEGSVGLLRTLLLNPLFSLRMALTMQKARYILEIFGPVLFLCFLDARGVVLVAYGTAMTVFASKPYLFQLGFQYPLQLVPEAFAGGLLALREKSGATGKFGITLPRALLAMTLVTSLMAYHEGMLSPVSVFRSGFRDVSLDFSQKDRERFLEVEKVARLIPPKASVTASETLVPHVARRIQLQTLRYARESFGGDYEYFFLLRSDLDGRTRETYAYVLNSPVYQMTYEGENVLLFRRQTS